MFRLSPPLHEHKAAVRKQLKNLENAVHDKQENSAAFQLQGNIEKAVHNDDVGGDDDEMSKELERLACEAKARKNKTVFWVGISVV